MFPKTLAVLLDIEGTTTPVDFVHQTLFPFARKHLREFLTRGAATADVSEDIVMLREEHRREARTGDDPPQWSEETIESAVSYAVWLIDRDRKSTALKSLQGKIWEQGYKNGELRGVVYEDVPIAFKRWKHQGKVIAIYSSGSVLAQKLIFAHTNAGDLTPFISSYFDTKTGPKKEASSYYRIADALRFEPHEIVFYSDLLAEVNAARDAGMQTALCVRDGDDFEAAGHRLVRDLTGD